MIRLRSRQAADVGEAKMSDVSIPDIIARALENVERHGDLPKSARIDARQLLDALAGEYLIVWNEFRGKYDLTSFGHKWLILYARARPSKARTDRSFFAITFADAHRN